ncbi:MAG: DUF2752 domain-containing protein [Lachnospiraceae bacterium]|nr:DUF2752 domain-containing protein [Lachnospiraceae bacterium]
MIKSRFTYLMEDLRRLRVPLLMLGVYCLLVFPIFHCFCPMVILLGIPCPACGLTRAAILLFGGHVQEAAEMNPSVFIWIPYLASLLLFRYGSIRTQPDEQRYHVVRDRVPEEAKKFPAVTVFTILTGITTILIYGIRMVTTGHAAPVAYHGLLRGLFP